MLRYLLRRFILLAITLLLTSVVIFGLTQLLPGDVARLILGRDARPEALANLRADLGLNDPVPVQYVNWLTGFVSGDWGTSFTGGRAPIRPLVLDRLGNSLRLAGLTLLISIPISILLGVLAGLNENRWVDSLISVLTLSVVGLPEFVTGLVLINVLALGLGWFPASSNVAPGADFGEWLRYLILPADHRHLRADGLRRPHDPRWRDRRVEEALRPHRHSEGTASASGDFQACAP